MVLCGVAAAIGIGIAAVLTPPIFREIGAGGLNLPLSVVVTGFGVAAYGGVSGRKVVGLAPTFA